MTDIDYGKHAGLVKDLLGLNINDSMPVPRWSYNYGGSNGKTAKVVVISLIVAATITGVAVYIYNKRKESK